MKIKLKSDENKDDICENKKLSLTKTRTTFVKIKLKSHQKKDDICENKKVKPHQNKDDICENKSKVSPKQGRHL